MGGGTFGTHSGLRASINAWLEEISFRTGMIAGAIVLVVIAAVGGAVAVFGHGGQAASALGSRGTANPATVAAPSTGPAAQPSAAPSSAAPTRSAASTPAPSRPAAASAPGTGSPAAAPVTGSGSTAVGAGSASSRENDDEQGGPAGWRHGFPARWGGREWVRGPYRDGTHFGGPWR